MKTIASFTFFLLLSFYSNRINYTLIDAENSNLPENDIWSIAVDSKGNKWLGTAKSGLVKMDSAFNMTVFNAENSPVNGQFITPVFIDNEDDVWLAQSKPDALLRFDGINWHTFSSQELKLPAIPVISIYQADNGNIYLAGANGISFFNGVEWQRIQLPGNQNYTCRAIAVSRAGDIAVGHNNGLLIREGGEWSSFAPSKSQLQSYVRSLYFEKEDRLYIGYGGNKTGGYSIKSGSDWQHFNKSNSKLSNNMVRDIEVGADGVMWLATNDGLNRIEHDEISSIFFRQGVYRNVIADIATEGDVAWVATRFGVLKVK